VDGVDGPCDDLPFPASGVGGGGTQHVPPRGGDLLVALEVEVRDGPATAAAVSSESSPTPSSVGDAPSRVTRAPAATNWSCWRAGSSRSVSRSCRSAVSRRSPRSPSVSTVTVRSTSPANRPAVANSSVSVLTVTPAADNAATSRSCSRLAASSENPLRKRFGNGSTTPASVSKPGSWTRTAANGSHSASTVSSIDGPLRVHVQITIRR
jgi:hypothetical protein